MKFKNYLNELFNSSYELNKPLKLKDYVSVDFDSTNGDNYMVTLIKKENFNINKTYIDIAFEDDAGRHSMNDKGDAIKIFSTVMKVIDENKKFIKSGDYVKFSAHSEEASRVKLYVKFAKMFKSKFNYKHHKEVKENNENVHYFYNEEI